MNLREPRFSARVPADLEPNRISRVLGDLRARGVVLIDLAETNPTRVGLEYPPHLLAQLADSAALLYDPRPFGSEAARRAVAGDYLRRGVAVAPGRIVLTSSTSEAYSLLFKLLCDPGDEVLAPRPSYPLFDHLTRLDSVAARPYDLLYDGRWTLDLGSVERALSPRTRAILAVSPNNPTGSFLAPAEIEALAAIAGRDGLALVGDEVFADYALDQRMAPAPSVLDGACALAFGLGGLSKSAGLPQIKLGWIAVAGPDPLVEAALARLEIVADAYLSVSTPAQQAAPSLIAAGEVVRARILGRIRGNLATLAELVGAHPSCSLLPVEGGWSAIVQVPATRTEEELVVALAAEDHVVVHPGYFFDFPREAFVVVSLLPEPSAFREGISRVLRRATS